MVILLNVKNDAYTRFFGRRRVLEPRYRFWKKVENGKNSSVGVIFDV